MLFVWFESARISKYKRGAKTMNDVATTTLDTKIAVKFILHINKKHLTQAIQHYKVTPTGRCVVTEAIYQKFNKLPSNMTKGMQNFGFHIAHSFYYVELQNNMYDSKIYDLITNFDMYVGTHGKDSTTLAKLRGMLPLKVEASISLTKEAFYKLRSLGVDLTTPPEFATL
jgi:hypothetical protein